MIRKTYAPQTRSLVRFLSTETTSQSSHHLPPAATPTRPPPTGRARFSPAPRPSRATASSKLTVALPYLPPTFGRNQLLSVPDSTRQLLEDIVASFRAPIRYAFAYGSGIFRQEGYDKEGPKPMLDFLFAVTHPAHFHSINLSQNPSHYPLHARLLGSSFVSYVENISPGVWFNAYVPVSGVTIKYGVVSMDTLCTDLLSWETLYLSGRMHKPIRIIKDDARVKLTQQVNLASAARTALLTLPEKFDESQLFERIAGFSYGGDPRMLLPTENPRKVSNIVQAQQSQFKELYSRLVNGLPGVHWPLNSPSLQQDTSPQARAALLRKLPSKLLSKLEQRYTSGAVSKEADAPAFWLKMANEPDLASSIQKELRGIVSWPATVQTAKGVVSAGVIKSLRYSGTKVSKWWGGRS